MDSISLNSILLNFYASKYGSLSSNRLIKTWRDRYFRAIFA